MSSYQGSLCGVYVYVFVDVKERDRDRQTHTHRMCMPRGESQEESSSCRHHGSISPASVKPEDGLGQKPGCLTHTSFTQKPHMTSKGYYLPSKLASREGKFLFEAVGSWG